jgi:hypothetical protein
MGFVHSARVAAVIAATVLTTAGAAFAVTGSGPIRVSNADVLYNGSIHWNPNSQSVHTGHGAMVVSGYLTDTNCNGDSVYVQAQVAGYGYLGLKENHNGCGSAHRVWDPATEVYDPAATRVVEGTVRACQDNAFWDTCTSLYRHR